MIDIKEIKISLMEKTGESSCKKFKKSEYIVKSSATLDFNTYMKGKYPEADEEDTEYILKNISNFIFEDLIGKTKDKFDSVGIWIKSKDNFWENAMDLPTLEGIKQYGEIGIVPVFELIKMTLPSKNE